MAWLNIGAFLGATVAGILIANGASPLLTPAIFAVGALVSVAQIIASRP